MILFLLAYLGGVLTILSPCILPVLPFVFARADQPFARSGLPMLIGMALTFALVATLAAVAGGWAVAANQYGRFAAVRPLALFGIALLFPELSDRLTRPLVALGDRLSQSADKSVGEGRSTVLASLLLGVATGLLWAPCAGPVLGPNLTGAALQGASLEPTFLLLVYAAGAATSLALALLVGGRVFAALKRSLGVGEWVRRGRGVAVLAAVVAIAFGLDTGFLTNVSLASTASIEQGLVDKFHAPPKDTDAAMKPSVVMNGPAMMTGEPSMMKSDQSKMAGSSVVMNGPAMMTGDSAMMKSDSAGMSGNGALMSANPAMMMNPVPVAKSEDLPVEGPAPSFSGAVEWLNSPPLNAEALKGKVVLVDFWTYSCINCLRAIPYVRAWAEKYKDQGLVVIGVHAPEFAFEKNIDNVKKAPADLKLTYPIAIDNDYAIWRAFDNQYWPAHYFIDAEGRIRHHHFGEGDYDGSERVIQLLLAEAGKSHVSAGGGVVFASRADAASDTADVKSPETYVGYDRGNHFVSPGGVV